MVFDIFNGLFDLDNDGHTDPAEQWPAYKIFEDCTGEDAPGDYSDDYPGDYSDTADDEW